MEPVLWVRRIGHRLPVTTCHDGLPRKPVRNNRRCDLAADWHWLIAESRLKHGWSSGRPWHRHGVEFKNDAGQVTGRTPDLQIKFGDSYRRERKRDGAEICRFNESRRTESWREQVSYTGVDVDAGRKQFTILLQA